MTTAESRALYTLASFLLGPCEQEKRHHLVPLVSQEEALAALEYLVSRKSPTGGVYSHHTDELREKWAARFGQVEVDSVKALYQKIYGPGGHQDRFQAACQKLSEEVRDD